MSLDRIRYFLLAADPGLVQLKHGAKTVLAVVIALEALLFFGSDVALYAGMSAGFLMQSTAGRTRKTRQITMASMGVASTIAVGLGSELSGHQWAKEILLVGAAFCVYYVRRYIPGKGMFPLFAFVLTLLATVQPSGARSAFPMMTAVAAGTISSFTVYFFLLPDESLRAFRHASNLFLFRLRHALGHQEPGEAILRVMHRAVALEEEERDTLAHLAPELCQSISQTQYEALQVMTLLVDMERHPKRGAAAQQSAAQFSQEYLQQVIADLERQGELLNA